MKIAGRHLDSQEHNAVVVNRHWRDRILGVKSSEYHWMRSILMRHLAGRGIVAKNVRRTGNWWEYTPGGNAWIKISGVLA